MLVTLISRHQKITVPSIQSNTRGHLSRLHVNLWQLWGCESYATPGLILSPSCSHHKRTWNILKASYLSKHWDWCSKQCHKSSIYIYQLMTYEKLNLPIILSTSWKNHPVCPGFPFNLPRTYGCTSKLLPCQVARCVSFDVLLPSKLPPTPPPVLKLTPARWAEEATKKRVFPWSQHGG